MRPRLSAAYATAVVVTALVSIASPASAAVVLEFSPSAAAVGDRVTGASDESGVPLPDATELEIFLAPSHRIADRARGPRDPRLARFGTLRVDEEGAGRFRGRVPRVPSGGYVAVAYCHLCNPGGSTFTVGEFRVSGAILPTTGSSTDGLVRGALVLLAGGAVASVRWRPAWGVPIGHNTSR